MGLIEICRYIYCFLGVWCRHFWGNYLMMIFVFIRGAAPLISLKCHYFSAKVTRRPFSSSPQQNQLISNLFLAGSLIVSQDETYLFLVSSPLPFQNAITSTKYRYDTSSNTAKMQSANRVVVRRSWSEKVDSWRIDLQVLFEFGARQCSRIAISKYILVDESV